MIKPHFTVNGVPTSMPRYAYSIRGKTLCLNDYWMIVLHSPGRADGVIEVEDLRKFYVEGKEPTVHGPDSFWAVASETLQRCTELQTRGGSSLVNSGMLMRMIRSLGLEDSELRISVLEEGVVRVSSHTGLVEGYLMPLVQDS